MPNLTKAEANKRCKEGKMECVDCPVDGECDLPAYPDGFSNILPFLPWSNNKMWTSSGSRSSHLPITNSSLPKLLLTKEEIAALYTAFVCNPYPHKRRCAKCEGKKACEIIKATDKKPHELRGEAIAKLKAYIDTKEG